MSLNSDTSRSSSPSTWLWIGLVSIASLALSRAFACATPFAALATLAALTLDRRKGVALVLATWLANQAVGFGLLHYPCTASTFGWGSAIGVAALAAFAASAWVGRRAGTTPRTLPLALLAAFAAYELVLFAATEVLPSGRGDFALDVVGRILAINAVALALLIAARLASLMLGHGATVRARPSA